MYPLFLDSCFLLHLPTHSSRRYDTYDDPPLSDLMFIRPVARSRRSSSIGSSRSDRSSDADDTLGPSRAKSFPTGWPPGTDNVASGSRTSLPAGAGLDRVLTEPVHSNVGASAFHSTHSLTGSARFRASAQRLIRLRRINASQPGSEPGVDPVRDESAYEHITAHCRIDVVDYGHDKVKFMEYDNKGFLAFLAAVGKGKDDWATVRWINVKGIDWGIIKALSLVYGELMSRRVQIVSKLHMQVLYVYSYSILTPELKEVSAPAGTRRRPPRSRLPQQSQFCPSAFVH